MHSILLSFLLLLFPACLEAAVPVLDHMPNASCAAGVTYVATPTLASRQGVRFTKEFGPDDLSVDPNTGRVSWAIPSSLPREAFHLGVRATNAEGTAYVTWILKVGGGKYIYVGPSDHYKTISAGTAAAALGDTIVVRDGKYTGASNMMANQGDRGSAAPSGTRSAYTTVMAEHPGGVLIDGEGVRVPISLNGNYDSRDQNAYTRYNLSYLAIKGFIVARASSGGPLAVNHAHHIKIIDCGAYDQAVHDSGAVLQASRSGYVLVEGCYTWGNGRYGINLYVCDNSIIRRCVVRIDRTDAKEPIGGIFHYATQHGRTQNSLVIDSDQPAYYRHEYDAGAFDASSGGARYEDWGTTKDVIMTNNLALNVYFTALANTRNGDNHGAPANQSDATDFRNGILWDIHSSENTTGYPTTDGTLLVPGDVTVNQATIGKLRSYQHEVFGSYFNGYDGMSGKKHKMINSIITDVKKLNGTTGGDLFYNWHTVDHNNIYNTGKIDFYETKSTNTITSNPLNSCLKYLPRIEPGCALQSAGVSGARVGANVMYLHGKSGTLWGEPGFDLEETIPLWPFPHEELIRSKMAAYSYDNGKLRGARGFCAAGQTLTNYVWGYLGNPVPPFDVSATAGNGKAVIAWNPPAQGVRSTIARYHIYEIGTGSRTRRGTVESDQTLSKTITGLKSGSTYRFMVTAETKNRSESGYSYVVSVTPSSALP